MIGPRTRSVLRVLSYLVLLVGPIPSLVGMAVDAGRGVPTPRPVDWQFWFFLLWQILLPIAVGAVLLTLLSIDERLERRT